MRWKRILSIVLASIVTACIIVLIFLSSIVKYLIEKHSEEYTGRKIVMDNLHINLFSGNIRFDKLKIFEAKSNAVFFACDRIEGTISTHKLFASKYDITELQFEKPVINIIQKGNKFNFSDLVKRFVTDAPPSPKNAKPTQYWIHNLEIDSANLVYVNTSPYNKIEVIDWDTKIPVIAWDNPVYDIATSLEVPTGGKLAGNLNINSNTFLYKTKFDLTKFNINVLYPYLKDYLKVKSLDGLLSASLAITGNMHKAADIAASGNMNAEDFAIVDVTSDRLTAFGKMDVQIDSINTKNNFYNFKTIDVKEPYVELSMYDDGYNFQRLMTSPGKSAIDTAVTAYANIFIMMADYVQSIIQNYVASNYNANQFKIEGGHFIFTDYTHGDKFQYDFDSLYMVSNKVSSGNDRITLNVQSLLNRSGNLKATLAVSPKNFQDMDIDGVVSGLLVSDFNPYSKYYVATPFLNGVATYTNKTTILNRKLTSKNVLDITKIEAGKKVKNKTAMNIPVRLAVSLLKDVHGNIHLDIPVSGSLDDPKFKWGKVIWQVVKNLIVKAATAPFRFFANAFGGKEEDYDHVSFDYMQNSINGPQKKVLDNLAKVLTEKPDLKLQLIQVTSREDEADVYALQQIKKQYLNITADSITTSLQNRIDSVDNKDSLFNKYVNGRLQSGSSFMSVQEKCVQIIGKEKIDVIVNSIMEKRNQVVAEYLTQQKQIVPTRLNISSAKDQLSRGQLPKYMINIATDEGQPDVKAEVVNKK
ncbi:MAG: DUF748 domain-containing protein [Bacteroidetes bacterium]|nr:DUF748 domain-containing protein [Bacteroidota bacterium]